MYIEFKKNAKVPASKQKDNWKVKMTKYNNEMTELFDIYCRDATARGKRETETGVTMSEKEFEFYEDMKSERKMFCDSFVDKRWERQIEYSRKKEARYETLVKKKKEDEERVKRISWNEVTEVVEEEATHEENPGRTTLTSYRKQLMRMIDQLG